MSAEATINFDNGADLHDPALYSPEAETDAIETFDDVTDEHIELYHRRGYLVVNRGFSTELINEAREGMLSLIKGENPDFEHVAFEASSKEYAEDLSIEERQDAVRKLMDFCDAEDRLKALRDEPNMRAVINRIVGSESIIFQEMALIKPPRIGREKPWHQDHAYFNIPLTSPCVGVWIALDKTTPENGCMHLMPSMYAKPIIHFQRRDWQICDTDMLGKKCLAVPLEPGGCLFWSSLMPHGSPTNSSDMRRRALQFHYVKDGTKRIDREDHKKIFGGEVQGKKC